MSRPSTSEQPSQHMVQGVIAGLTAAIFILDIFFPLGFAVPVLYLLPIIFTVRLVRPMAPFVIAACATGLTILGIWTSSIPSLQPGLFNRSLVILASWLAATLIWHTTQKHTRRKLEILVEARTAALRQSESTLHSFFDATDLMMGVVEVVDGKLVTVITNRTAAAVVGTTSNSSANHPLSEFGFEPGAWDFWMPHLEKARRSGQTVHAEHQFPDKPPVLGNRSIASAVTFIGLSAQGNPLYAWIEEDITEKKQLEQRMDSNRRSLEASQTQLRHLTAQLLTAQEDERRRIARELHDDVNQRVVSLAYEIDNQLQQTPDLPADAREALQLVKNEVADLSDHVRDLARRLHPSVLDDLGIASALQVCAQEFQQRERIPVHLTLQKANRPLDRNLSQCLFRVTQEALRNVAKHARATQVHLALTFSEGHVMLQIDDDGCGFTPQHRQNAHQGLGLISMGERVRLVQGTMTISSDIGCGTHLSISLPFTGVGNEQTSHSAR
ncbi:MAG TPA: sensor histidine kinase [Nitrospira sp.]|nr:sensor histidine kinase [Nitrospira sp.]